MDITAAGRISAALQQAFQIPDVPYLVQDLEQGCYHVGMGNAHGMVALRLDNARYRHVSNLVQETPQRMPFELWEYIQRHSLSPTVAAAAGSFEHAIFAVGVGPKGIVEADVFGQTMNPKYIIELINQGAQAGFFESLVYGTNAGLCHVAGSVCDLVRDPQASDAAVEALVRLASGVQRYDIAQLICDAR